MKTLVLLLTGPMQAWGEAAPFSQRHTLAHPTRSGVIGMLSCALGLPRGSDLAWAKPLMVHIRVDRQGEVIVDFQTVGGGLPAGQGLRSAAGEARDGAILTNRYYLHDAAFTATVTVPDDELADQLAAALVTPRWPLFLGRKSCPPSHPVLLGVTAAPSLRALTDVPLYHPARPRREDETEMPASDDFFGAVAAGAEEAPKHIATVYLDKVAAGDSYTVINDDPVSNGTFTREHRPRHVGVTAVRAHRTSPSPSCGVGAWIQMRDALAALTEPSLTY